MNSAYKSLGILTDESVVNEKSGLPTSTATRVKNEINITQVKYVGACDINLFL